jgi:hypothetical protein
MEVVAPDVYNLGGVQGPVQTGNGVLYNIGGNQYGQQVPDKRAARTHLQRFVQGLEDAGAPATAGTTLVESIRKVAGWLHPVSAAVVRLL